jgi:hypothetical protein
MIRKGWLKKQDGDYDWLFSLFGGWLFIGQV